MARKAGKSTNQAHSKVVPRGFSEEDVWTPNPLGLKGYTPPPNGHTQKVCRQDVMIHPQYWDLLTSLADQFKKDQRKLRLKMYPNRLARPSIRTLIILAVERFLKEGIRRGDWKYVGKDKLPQDLVPYQDEVTLDPFKD